MTSDVHPLVSKTTTLPPPGLTARSQLRVTFWVGDHRRACGKRLAIAVANQVSPVRSGKLATTVYSTRSTAGSGCSPRYSTQALFTHG